MTSSKQIEVSIIVPAYNEEKTISDCLDSLLSQNYPSDKYEVIVVNDGSTDNTESIVRVFAKEHPHVVLISKENGGKGSAQNFGLKYARGNLVLITDADAIVPSDWISTMIQELHKADVALGGCYLGLTAAASSLEKIQNAQYLINFKYGGLKGMPGSGINIGFKKAVAHSLGGFNEDIKSITVDFVKRAQAKGYASGFNPDIAVQTRGTSSLTGFIKQKLRWREYPLGILKGTVKPSKSDIIGIGYTHGLSLALLALTILAIVWLDFRYFLAPFILILMIDALLYIKPIIRMWRDGIDRNYVFYFLTYSVLIMLVRLALIPYLIYCLARGSKPTFEPRRT